MKKKKKKISQGEVSRSKGRVVSPVSDQSIVFVDTLKWDVLSIVFIILVAFLLYFYTLNYPFQFDDFYTICRNSYIKNLRNFSYFLEGVGIRGGWYRTLPTLSFALNYHFHQLDVVGYHLINLILHMGCGVLVYFISKQFFALGLKGVEGGISGGKEDFFTLYRDRLFSLFVAMVFIVHPIQVNTVNYIVQRYEGMASFFYLLVFFLFMKGSFSKRLLKFYYFCGAGIIFFFAILSKETSFTLPIMMMLFDLLFVCRGWEQVKRRLRVYSGCGVVLAVYLLFFLKGGMLTILFRQTYEWTPWENLLTQANVIIQYIKLLFFPWPGWLNIDHDFRISRSLFELPTVLSVLAILSLFFLVVYFMKRNRLISFGILWFFIVLAPTSSLIPIWDIMVEYRLYLPMFSFGLFLALGINYSYQFFIHRFPKKISQGPFIGVMILILCLYSIVTDQRNYFFRDTVTIWEDAVKKSPERPRVYINLGMMLHQQKRLEEAREIFEKALMKFPKEHLIYYNLGEVYSDLKEYGKAITYLERYLKTNPNNSSAHQEIGSIYLRMGSLEKAYSYLQKALEIDYNNAQAHSGLGDIYLQKGMIDEVISEYKKAIRIDPGLAIAHLRLGEAYFKKGMVEEASLEMKKAMSIDPNLTNAYNAIGAIYLQEGKLAEAFELLKKALVFNPKDPEVYNNLGIGYHKKGQIDEAIAHYQKAIELNPNFFDAHINLGEAYRTKKMGEEAVMEYKKAISIHPHRPEPYNVLGVFLIEKRKVKEAISYIEKAISIDPKYGEGYFNLAVAYYHQKNFQKALAYCQQALDLGYEVDPKFLRLLKSNQ